MTINEMLEIKNEYGYSYEYIAELSGVPASTVQKVLGGATKSPRRTTLAALRKIFEKILSESKNKNVFPKKNSPEDFTELSFVSESPDTYYTTDGTGALSYNSFTGKTVSDYLSLPKDVRVELIDGVFYDMASPTTVHQRICFDIGFLLQSYIYANNGSCQTFTAPLDVQLDCDEKTMVQPDIIVLCDESKLTKERIVGAPDLIIEVLSPTNWYHDTTRKLLKYKKAGVKEYWIVMPDNFKVLVYYFEKSDLPTEYTFTDEIPVSIWNSKCKIDFKKIQEKIKKCFPVFTL